MEILDKYFTGFLTLKYVTLCILIIIIIIINKLDSKLINSYRWYIWCMK